jgi:hypothetical protein
LRWWRFRSPRKPKEQSAALKKALKSVGVPLALSALLLEELSALPPARLAGY